MKKISLILLIPFGSLIGISILFNVYNDYLKMAASQYNYDYLYICLFRLLEALILFISILVYMKDIQKEHPIHENRATESICTEPCNPLLRATKSMKRATSTY